MKAATRFKAVGSIAKLSTVFGNNINNINNNIPEEIIEEA
ncbi:hypothetical protein BDFB_004485 [Asbolus verrucosus]|uniref:Uncharacterized protein n=1 Tax=Asbolus verrucosus TaxID=1661398 RepID=A0A482W3F6_ASBVE|nr:hypothetical protein BDFB_004485 [Asbolus verrucosus]